MTISEEQLTTWSHQGSVTQSSSTYNQIKQVLENPSNSYANKLYTVFLQGSYGNDTNIFAESDVDVVIRLDSIYNYDISKLPADQAALYKATVNPPLYTLAEFKNEVVNVLKLAYGDDVKVGPKAVAIAPRGGRRKADVIVAISHKKYLRYLNNSDQQYIDGIRFDSTPESIINFPKLHSSNLTSKHQTTNQWFKPTARILKNMKTKMVSRSLIASDLAPSYYIEGLLYNVPSEHFGKSYQDTFISSINWIIEADRSKFTCANEQYYLLYENSPVTWRSAKCDSFLKSLSDFWQSGG